jgi:glycine/D-amino acid oxidase-like deaminating enzyme
MKINEFDTAIIGAGCVGSGIAYDITRRGFRNTVVIDSGRKTQSATASSGGMLRVFHENQDHMQLALNNFKLLKRYQDRGAISEKTKNSGHLYFFNSRRFPSYTGNFQKMESEGYAFEILTSTTGRQKFPQFNWADDEWAVFEPTGTQLSALRLTDDLLAVTQKNGLTFYDDFHVDRICHFRNRYKIFSGDSIIIAKTLILAGGARMLPHLTGLGVSHSLEAKPITTFVANKKNPEQDLPNFFDRESLDYGRLGSGSQVILSSPVSQRLVEPIWENKFTEVTALDCYAPNRAGFAGFLLGHPRLMLATGWGGTAFKFSLEIGQRIGHALEASETERSLRHA